MSKQSVLYYLNLQKKDSLFSKNFVLVFYIIIFVSFAVIFVLMNLINNIDFESRIIANIILPIIMLSIAIGSVLLSFDKKNIVKKMNKLIQIAEAKTDEELLKEWKTPENVLLIKTSGTHYILPGQEGYEQIYNTISYLTEGEAIMNNYSPITKYNKNLNLGETI